MNLERDSFATEIKVFWQNKIQTFQLSVLELKSTWMREDNTEYFLGYVNVIENTYTRNFYSGGATGFGISDIDRLDKLSDENQVKIITTELNEIIQMVNEANVQVVREREAFNKAQEEKVKRINQLPEKFDIPGFSLLQIERTKAEYRKTWSIDIQGASVYIDYKNGNPFYLNRYTTKSGGLQIKKFVKECEDLIGDNDQKTVLQTLINEVEHVKYLIKNA